MDSKELLRSPTLPAEPAPAYTPLANNDTTYHLTPLLNGRVGDIELETIDGKKFLVHKSVLEAETVFFHIYYGFVPVWRLNGSAPAPYHTSAAAGVGGSIPSLTSVAAQNTGALSHLRKIIASTLGPSAPSSSSSAASSISAGTQSTTSQSQAPSRGSSPPPAFSTIAPPPPLPPKTPATVATAVTAPTPTSSPYTWLVPEQSTILTAFLALIYPRGTFTARQTDLLTSPDITGRVIRASLGYQSTKALTLARDHLSQPGWIERFPLDVYSLACFFKFGDLARLSSGAAVRRPMDEWMAHRPVMGRQGQGRLQDLHDVRVRGLRAILDGAIHCAHDDEVGHMAGCEGWMQLRGVWEAKIMEVRDGVNAGSDLLELLDLDVREGSCGHCLLGLGRTVQRCLLKARELPTTI